MASMDFDVDDYLRQASSRAMHAELQSRIARKEWNPPVDENDAEPWTPAGLAADIRNAFYARNASRLEILLTALERKESVNA